MTTLQPGAFVFACCSTFLSWIQWIRWPALASWPELLFRMRLAPAQPASRRWGSCERIAPAPIPAHSEAAATERHRVWDRSASFVEIGRRFRFRIGGTRAGTVSATVLRDLGRLPVRAAFPQDDSRVQGAMAFASPLPELELQHEHQNGCGEAPSPPGALRGSAPLRAQVGENSFFQSRARFDRGVFRQRRIEHAVEVASR